MIKQLLRVTELTVPEQRVVIFALVGLVAFVTVKTWRNGAKDDRGPAAALHHPSPSPGIRP